MDHEIFHVDQVVKVPHSSSGSARKVACNGKFWPVRHEFIAENIPQGSNNDIGRLVIRKANEITSQQTDARGWAAVGVVVDFVALREERIKNVTGIPGEIGDEMSALYKGDIMDKWHILFGNSETEIYDVTRLIQGLNMYQKVKLSADLQATYGVEAFQLMSSSVPPGMRKKLLGGHSGKSAKLQKQAANPGHNVVDPAIGKSDTAKKEYSNLISSSDGTRTKLNMPTAPSSSHQYMSQFPDSTNCRTESDGDSLVCCMCDRLYSTPTHAGNKAHSLSAEGYAYCGRCSAAIAAVTFKEHSPTTLTTVTRNVPRNPSQSLTGSDVFTYPILKRKEVDFNAGHIPYSGDYFSIESDSMNMSKRKRKKGPSEAALTGQSRVTQYALPRHQIGVATGSGSLPPTAATTLPTHHQQHTHHHLSSASSVALSAPQSLSILESGSSKKWKTRNRNKQIAVLETAGPIGATFPALESDSSDDARTVKRRSGIRTHALGLPSHFLSEASMKGSTYELYRQCWIEDTIPALLTTVSAMRCPFSQEITCAMLRGMTAFQGSDCKCSETVTETGSTQSVGDDRGMRQHNEMITLKDWLSDSSSAHSPSVRIQDSSVDAKRGDISSASSSSTAALGRNATNICAVVIDFQTKSTHGREVEGRAERNARSELFLRPFVGGSGRLPSNTSHVQESDRAVEDGLDLYLNAGGPIWTTAFAPDVIDHVSVDVTTGSTISRFVKYLAVGTSRVGWEGNSVTGEFNLGDDASYALGQKVRTRNLLQIWAISKAKKVQIVSDRSDGPILMNRRAAASASGGGYDTHGRREGYSGGADSVQQEQDSAHLCYCVAVDRGPVWKIAWSPWVPFTSKEWQARARGGLLGVLAVVCGDGSCLVLVLPTPDANQTSSLSSGVDTVRVCDAMSVHVLSEKSVCRFVLTVPKGFDPSDGSGSGSGSCGGIVEVYPHSMTKNSSNNNNNNNNNKRESKNDDIVSILSVAWNAQKPLQICCGLLDGNVAVFDLEPYLLGDARTTSTTPSALNTASVGTEKSTIPSTSSRVTDVSQGALSIVPFILLGEDPTRSNNVNHRKAAVRSTTFCPYHPHLILSSGYSSDVSVWNTNSSNGPALVRSFPTENGWVYDAQWDPQGRGFYGGCSDRSAVCWDSLAVHSEDPARKGSVYGNRNARESDASTMYRHDGSLECVWGVHTFLCDGQTVVASVSSDGTFRCAFASTLTESLGSRCSQGNSSSSGGSTSGKAARSTLDLWILEVFRFEGSHRHHAAAEQGVKEIREESHGWGGPVATVKVRGEATLQVSSGTIAHTAQSVAIHAFDSSSCYSDAGNYHPTCRMFAYGGAAGILRVHVIDVLAGIVN